MAVGMAVAWPRHATLDEIWESYLVERDLVHRNELVVAYQFLVNETVQKLPRHVLSYWEADDLRSFGQDGLLRAIARWKGPDHSRFDAYARRCVRGAIFDELRRLDWMTRSARKRVIAYRSTYDSLVGELGRNPRPTEVCASMGLSRRQADELMSELGASQLLHVEGGASSEGAESSLSELIRAEQAEPEGEIVACAEAQELEEAMGKLSQRERTVMLLSFFCGMTQDQIGRIVRVGGPQVCKIHGAALRKLRSSLRAGQVLESAIAS